VWIEVLGYFNMLQEGATKQDTFMNPTTRIWMVEMIRSQIQGVEEKTGYVVNVRHTEFNSREAGMCADVYIAVRVRNSRPMPPDYSILSIDARGSGTGAILLRRSETAGF
jgi:hypothetical protein